MGAASVLLYGLTAMGPQVRAALHLTQFEFGLFATAMYATAALSGRFAGALADRASARTILATLYVAAVAAVVGASVAPTFPLVVVALVASGFAISFANPVTNRLVAARPDRRRRGLLVGVKQSGIQVAQLLTGLALPAIGLALGWRLALDVALVFPLAGAVLAWRFTSTRGGPRVAPARRRTQPSAPLGGVMWWLCAYALLVGVGTQATGIYLPLFGFDEVGLRHVGAGLLIALIGGVGIAARVGWGQLTSRARSSRPLMAGLAGVAAIGGALLLVAGVVHAAALLWCGTFVFAASGVAINAVTMATTIKLSAPGALGRATGTVTLGLFVGFVAGDLSFGALSQRLGYSAAWALVIAGYAAGAALIACARTSLRSEARAIEGQQ